MKYDNDNVFATLNTSPHQNTDAFTCSYHKYSDNLYHECIYFSAIRQAYESREISTGQYTLMRVIGSTHGVGLYGTLPAIQEYMELLNQLWQQDDFPVSDMVIEI